MKKPFEVGDRVKVYATLNGSIAETPGEVVRLRPDGMLFVNLRGRNGEIVAHPKQCRRLIQKTRRRVWVRRDYWGSEAVSTYLASERPTDGYSKYDWDEFVEVRKK